MTKRKENPGKGGCTSLQVSSRKKDPGTTSQYMGVTWCRQHKRWNAKIGYRYQTINLGVFQDEEEAAIAYLQAGVDRYGPTFRKKDQEALNLQINEHGKLQQTSPGPTTATGKDQGIHADQQHAQRDAWAFQ